jgi:tetratricopeptide (TPR) repeat protein
VKKQQLVLIGSAAIIVLLLFFFGKTVPAKKPSNLPENTTHTDKDKAVDVQKMLTHAKERLTPAQVQKVTTLENIVVRGDVKNQQLSAYKQLASYWGDSIRLFEPYAYYTAEAAKLENSEKSLTFAAHLFLNSLKTEREPAMQTWLGTNAKVLFEKALQLNPANDSSKIGLGACYIFGNISNNPMEGIAPIRQIAEKDPNNMFAQFILGLGGIKSGQYDKAAERLLIVMEKQPDNLEAAINLAEAYDQKGDKANAVKWYTYVKNRIPNDQVQKELDQRIKALH